MVNELAEYNRTLETRVSNLEGYNKSLDAHNKELKQTVEDSEKKTSEEVAVVRDLLLVEKAEVRRLSDIIKQERLEHKEDAIEYVEKIHKADLKIEDLETDLMEFAKTERTVVWAMTKAYADILDVSRDLKKRFFKPRPEIGRIEEIAKTLGSTWK